MIFWSILLLPYPDRLTTKKTSLKKKPKLYARILEAAKEDGMKQQDAQQHMENFFHAIKDEKFEGEFANAKKGGGQKKNLFYEKRVL